MAPEEEPQFAAWKNARNPGAPAATSPQAAAPQPTTYAPQAPATGGTAGPARGGFLSGFAKGLGAPELANTINDYNASKVTKGAFPFPSAVPPQDAAMGNTPPPVNEPEPEVPVARHHVVENDGHLPGFLNFFAGDFDTLHPVPAAASKADTPADVLMLPRGSSGSA